jgi:hypothetical protein
MSLDLDCQTLASCLHHHPQALLASVGVGVSDTSEFHQQS